MGALVLLVTCLLISTPSTAFEVVKSWSAVVTQVVMIMINCIPVQGNMAKVACRASGGIESCSWRLVGRRGGNSSGER